MKKRVLSMIIAIVMVVGLIPVIALPASAATSTKGGLTVTGGTLGVDFEWGKPIYDVAGGVVEANVTDEYKIHLVVKTDTPITVSGTGVPATSTNTDGSYYGQTVRVAEGVTANVTFDGVTLKSSTMYNSPVVVHENATLNLTLKGDNVLSSGRAGPSSGDTYPMPAVFVKKDATLVVTADSTGTLTASADMGAAVIGGQGGANGQYLTAGSIIINGGTFNLTADGNGTNTYYYSGACIGAGNAGSFEEIVINGGTINGTSKDGAVIGGGYNYTVGNLPDSKITVNGGVINATTSHANAQAVGSGYRGSIGTIEFNGGILFDDNDGSILGTSYTLKEDATVPAGKTLTINSDQTLTVPSGMTLTVDGTLANSGTVTGNVVAPPTLTLTSSAPAASPGSTIKMSVVAKNAFDESDTDVPTSFKTFYRVGTSGSFTEVSGLNITVPTTAVVGETLYVYVQNVAVDGKYTVGTSNTVELFVGQIDYTEEIEKVKTELSGAISDLETALDTLETTVGDMDTELQGFIQSATNDINDLLADLNQLSADLDALEAVVGDDTTGLVKALNDATDRIADAEIRLDGIDAEITNAQTRLGTLEGEMDAAEGRLDGIDTEITTAKNRLDAVDNEITAAKGRLDTLEDEMDVAEGRLDTLEDEMDVAEGRLDTLEDEMDVTEDRLDTLEDEMDAAEGRLDAAEGRLDTAEGEIDALEKNSATKTELTEAKRTLNEEIEAVSAALESAKTELNTAIAENKADLDTKITNLNTALDNAIAAYKKADGELKAELESDIAEAKDALEDAIEAVQTNLDTTKAALEGADKDLDDKIGALETELKSADEAMKAELEAAIASAKADLAKAVKDGDDKAAADLAAAVEALEAEIAQAEKDARTAPLVIAIIAVVGDIALLAWILVLKRKI